MNSRSQRAASQPSRAARFAVLASTLVLLSIGWPGCGSMSSDPGTLDASTILAMSDPAPAVAPTATPPPSSTRAPEPTPTPIPLEPTTAPVSAAQARAHPTAPAPTLIRVSPTPISQTPTSVLPAPTRDRPTPSQSPPTHNVLVAASVTNASPAQQTEVTVVANFTDNGNPIVGALMTASWYYKTVTRTCTGTTNSVGVASCTRYIAGATIGYKVLINIEIVWHGQRYTASTSFTPK